MVHNYFKPINGLPDGRGSPTIASASREVAKVLQALIKRGPYMK